MRNYTMDSDNNLDLHIFYAYVKIMVKNTGILLFCFFNLLDAIRYSKFIITSLLKC